jgi:FKBP-type peptidyl-prolyl cis-trans isomerase FkpA
MSRKPIAVLAAAVAILALSDRATAQQTPPAGAASVPVEGRIEVTSEQQKTLYALGVALSQNLVRLNLEASELTYVVAGLEEGVLGTEPRVDLDQYMPKLQAFAQERFAAAAAREQTAAQVFLDRMAGEAGAVKTESGIVYFSLQEGSGATPAPKDVVSVHYRGTLPNGVQFDSSIDRGQPASFALDQVIPCWTEAVQKMKVGGKARIVCPPALAYGAEGRPGIPPNAPLVFEVELLGIEAPAPAPAPDSQETPPPPGEGATGSDG